jgi:8-oxo-dGTP diphosphatase
VTFELERPVLAVDVVLLRVHQRELQALLRHRREAPFKGALALPGVAVGVDETLLAAARRALLDRAGLEPETLQGVHLEQLASFDGLYRDPRGRTVSVAYLGLVRAGQDPSGPGWTALGTLDRSSLPFDHAEILQEALQRLRGKLRYTNIAAHLLPRTFRIEELQATYEAVLGRPLNRANFRSKLLKIGLIQRAGVLSQAVGRRGGRPPHVYRFVQDRLEVQDRDFL